jgi:hypothetical protein
MHRVQSHAVLSLADTGGFGEAIAIISAACIGLPTFKSAEAGIWRRGRPLAVALVIAIVAFNIGLLARTVAELPFGISPMPMSIILAGFITALLTWISAAAMNYSDPNVLSVARWSSAGIGLACTVRAVPHGLPLSFLNADWSQSILIACAVSLPLALMPRTLWGRLGMGVLMASVGGTFAGATWLVGQVYPIKAMLALASGSMLILGFAQISTGIAMFIALTLFALVGGALGHYRGAMYGAGLFGLLFSGGLTWGLSRGGDSEAPSRLNKYWSMFEAAVLRILEPIILSPLLCVAVALLQRFPWRPERFLQFCQETFLVRHFGPEFEFIHRLLRDHFALAELIPAIGQPTDDRRLSAIQSLGYQGEASLDLLGELSTDRDPRVRAAALSAAGHISSPTVAYILQQAFDDREPQVRGAIIRSLFKLPLEQRRLKLDLLEPLGDGSEADVLLDFVDEINNRFMVGRLLVKLGPPAVEPLLYRLGDKDQIVRGGG